MRRGGLVGVAVMIVSLMITAGAWGETTTFASQGCFVWTVRVGVTSVTIDATGAAGGAAVAGTAVPGKGDGYSGTVSHLAGGETFFVCVDMSGGAGGGPSGTETSGHGGGASGVGYGTNFESPVLVAAGGGGAADQHEGFTGFGDGGNAGEAGHDGTDRGSGGGAGTLTEPGEGGTGNFNNGEPGTKFSENGPGHGGAGGPNIGGEPEAGAGGGGGYYGGGGGGSGKGSGGGGGGGSDFCGNGATSCEAHTLAGTSPNAGREPGQAKVTLTYTALPTSKAQCKKGGWKNFGTKFKNQGQCVSFVAQQPAIAVAVPAPVTNPPPAA